MPDQPLVSIIIPTFNRAHLIGETLDSVLAQTYANWECIVVDDGSTDGTSDLMEAYCAKDSRFQYHHRPKDRLPGGNAARNYGFELSKGTYVNWFDSDDIMLPSKLEIKIKHFLDSNHIDVVFCECASFYLKEGKKVERQVFYLKYTSFERDFILRKLLIQTASGLWKRCFVEKVRFDESLLQSQDYDFMISVLQLKPMVFEINKVLYLFRKKNESISSKYEKKTIAYVESYLKVKFRILKLYEKDSVIEKGITNHILHSLNNALSRNDKLSVSLHRNYIRNYNKCFKYSLLKKKWKSLNYITWLISFFGVGAYRFRKIYSIK